CAHRGRAGCITLRSCLPTWPRRLDANPASRPFCTTGPPNSGPSGATWPPRPAEWSNRQTDSSPDAQMSGPGMCAGHSTRRSRRGIIRPDPTFALGSRAVSVNPDDWPNDLVDPRPPRDGQPATRAALPVLAGFWLGAAVTVAVAALVPMRPPDPAPPPDGAWPSTDV